MSDDFNRLKVNIYGTEYPIKGSTDTEYIKNVAKYVDSKMREINKNVSIDSTLKVAILAALNITDELFHEREQKSNISGFHDRIKELNLKLDTCLNKFSL